jgi:hypothetical protein
MTNNYVIKATENVIAWGKIEFARRCISDFMFSNKWLAYDENIKTITTGDNTFTTFIFVDEETEKEVFFMDFRTMKKIVDSDSFEEIYNIVYNVMNKLMSDYFRGLNKKD